MFAQRSGTPRQRPTLSCTALCMPATSHHPSSHLQMSIHPFPQEFPARSRQYYTQALADGRLRVEGRPRLSAETPLPAGSRMRHYLHRHEPPVPSDDVRLLAVTDDIVAVHKPHGMPVHVAGQYRKNTVLGLLTAAQPQLGSLLPCHRLDRPVSGVLLFARHPAAAAALCKRIQEHSVQKVYVARVLGQFPATGKDGSPTIVEDADLSWDANANTAFAFAKDRQGAEGAALEVASKGLGVQQETVSNGSSEQPAEHAVPRQPGGYTAQAAAGREDRSRDAAAADLVAMGGEAPAAATAVDEREQREGGSAQQLNGSSNKTKKRRVSKEERVAAFHREMAASKARPAGRTARPAETHFRLLGVAADSATSVVECIPLTGRTHQIRAHLAWLGHPVANDLQYGGRYDGPAATRAMAQELGVLWRPSPGAEGDNAGDNAGNQDRSGGAAASADANSAQQQQQQQIPSTQSGASPALDGSGGAGVILNGQAGREPRSGGFTLRNEPKFEVPPELIDPHCPHCPYYYPLEYPVDLRPLWLHARTYSCSEWAFTAEPPQWADLAWVPPVPGQCGAEAAELTVQGAL